MIVTTKHGRKKSILTPEEVEDRAGDIISNLSPEEQDLLFGLLDDDTKEQLEVEKNMLQHRYHTIPVSMEQFIEDPYYLGESCSTLYPTLREDLIELFNHPYREFLTTGAIGVGKCVTGDTNVTHWNTGERIAIEKAVQLDDGSAKIPSLNTMSGRVEWTPCRFLESGIKRVGDFRLESGRSVGLSPDHPALTPNGYACVGDMRQGDIVATSGFADNDLFGNELEFATTQNFTTPILGKWWNGKRSDDVFWDRVESYTLREGFEPVYDVEVPSTHNFLAHGIVVHNTFSLSIAVCRILYDLSCLINPQKTFGLSSGTEMVIPLISKSLWLARSIIKTAVDDKLKESPYFMEKFAPRFSKDSTLFPNNIRVTIGSYGSERILGSNVFSAILDECFRKFSLISVDRGGKREKVAIGDLLAMGPEERADCKVVSLDHDQKKICAGWWRIKESTVQHLVEIKTARESTSPSLEHPVLVRRGYWCVYINAVDVVPGDYVVVEEDDTTKWTEVEYGSEDASELEFAGVRPERIRVCDIPDGLTLEKVISTRVLEPEQTYSLCTEHKTFIADGFVVHNTNFPPKRNSQQITTAIGQRKTAAHFDPVEKVYRNLVRRIKSRFQKAGGEFPGMVMLASSAATLESFTERKVRESREDPLVFVRDHTPWTAKPETEFCGEKFWVVCSTSSLRARILEEEEYDSVTDEYLEENDAWLIDVPIEYLTDFETDIENALRDIAGISTQAISSFVQRPEAVDACATNDIIHAFSLGEWTAGGPGGFLWRKICKQYERTLPGGYKEEAWAPRMNPKKLRWCHIDTSLSGDATGFCVGHIDRWVEVVRRSEHGEHFQELAPFYVIDVVLRINPPPGEQIYLPDIRRLVYELQAHGYSFAGLSTDTYQYAEMHQQVRRRGITPHIVSMDRTTEPYDELKRAIYEDRIRFHKYEPFIEELKNLEYDRLKGKIDHPQSGSKDVSDAVAGTVFSLLEHSARLPIALGSDTSNKSMHSDSWVSRKIPASNVDIDDVRERIEDANDDSDFVPILFGD